MNQVFNSVLKGYEIENDKQIVLNLFVCWFVGEELALLTSRASQRQSEAPPFRRENNYLGRFGFAAFQHN